MLRKIVFTISIFLILPFVLTGCVKLDSNEMVQINTPKNDNLSIKGKWDIESYEVIDKSTYSKDSINSLKGKNIIIDDDKIKVGDKEYVSVSYKLKVVKSDYEISYGSKFTASELGMGTKDIEVITASDKNNIIFDFFKNGDSSGYIYYQGVLFKVKKVDKAREEEFNASVDNQIESKASSTTKGMDKGLYLTLKTPRVKLDDGSYSDEKYRTLWVSYVDGKVRPVDEVSGILFPRMSGMWVLDKKHTEKDGYTQEYFTASQFKRESKDEYKIEKGVSIYSNINYISNDYILTEKYKGNDFQNKFPDYVVLPVDNLLSDRGIVISDIYPKNINSIYENDFSKKLKSLSQDEIREVMPTINYGNFTVKRDDGKWDLYGRISPIDPNGKSFDYPLNIKPNASLVNFDTLSIPWRALRGEVPLIKDAYMSPDGKLAVILIENEILVYNVIDGNKLETTPSERYEIKDDEKVIMSDWCESDYVEMWGNTFKEFKKEVNKEG
ncbi:MAG: hypothetical protein ACRDCB_01060 [Clostridium sp.]